MADNKKNTALGASVVCCFVAFGLVVILVPLSLGYVNYWEYGLDRSKITRAVDTDTVYGPGRYWIGPSHEFIKYQKTAHFETLEGLSVFSAGSSNASIGLEFGVDVGYAFVLIEDEIGDLHKELAKNYRNVITSRAKDAIKNAAVGVKLDDYFADRVAVEERFRQAVSNRWNDPPSLHCELDQFHLGRITIPPSVEQKLLEAQIQNERNGREAFSQTAEIEREQTAVMVNSIRLETERVLRNARAEAALLRSKAVSEADRVRATAFAEGTQTLLQSAGLTTEDQYAAFSYIRTLRNHKNLSLTVSHWNPNNVVQTRPV